ncbi:minor capsid protein [Lactococcus phage 58502]|nr:minor capsid protein [Lactococcus phage 58502]
MDEKQQALKNFKKALKAGMPDSEKDLANLSNDLASFYRKYLKDLKVQLKTWLELYDQMSFSEQLQVERLLNVANVINNLIGELGINVRQSIKAHIVKQGTDAYNSVWYELEQSNNILLDFDVLDPHYLETIMERPVAGKRLSKRLEDNVNQLAKASNNAISRGFMQGKAYADIARDISTETQASYKRAVRIARTESGRVSSISTQKAYKEATGKGIDLKKMWLATLDGHTREDHQHVDGQIREVDKMFQVGGYDALGPHQVGVPSEDINCRCTTRPIVHGIMPTVRRNNITGKVGEWKSYDDWLKEQGKKNSGKNIPVSLKGLNDDYLNEKREESRLKAGRVNAKKYDAQSESFAKLTNEASMRMRISDIGFRRAVESGNFKSSHEFGDSFDKGRIRIEKTLFNLPENIKRSEMPKYGYLSDSDDLFEKKARHSVLGYGDITIEFDDSVRKRTTYTVNDSLFNRRGLITSATPVGTKPTYNGIKEKAIGEINSISEFLNSNKKTNRYIEAQYHGDLTFKNDVKRIIVPDKSYLDKFSKEFEQLKNMGIEVLVAPK